MKKVLFILALIISANCFAQTDSLLKVMPMKEGKVFYEGVVSVDSSTKDELYNKAKRWFVETFASAKDVIQLDDKENGEIIGKGLYNDVWQYGFLLDQNIDMYFTIRIYIKEGRYKYEMTDFKIHYYMPNNYTNGITDMSLEQWCTSSTNNKRKFLTKDELKIKSTLASLQNYMNKKLIASSKDW